jgi:citrate lyase subunit beta/citryl-CoA lyase
MPLRSFLFVPGDSEAKLAGSSERGADALILDLEDSVAPVRKDAARALVATHLRDPARDRELPCLVRVNAIQTGLAWDDLEVVLPAGPDGLLLPKGDPLLLGELDGRLEDMEQRLGLRQGALPVWVLATETARGVFTIGEFSGVSPRLRGLSWGHEDLATELGAVNKDPDGRYAEPFRMVQWLCALGAAAAGVDPIDGASMNFRDLDAFTRECEDGRRAGFVGKLAIHPAQVPIINRVFTPSADEIAWARRVVAAFAEQPDLGVIALDGRVVDRPHVRLAERLLARL